MPGPGSFAPLPLPPQPQFSTTITPPQEALGSADFVNSLKAQIAELGSTIEGMRVMLSGMSRQLQVCNMVVAVLGRVYFQKQGVPDAESFLKDAGYGQFLPPQ